MNRLSTLLLSTVACFCLAAPLGAQELTPSDRSAQPKANGGDPYEQMSPMGYLAGAVRKARKGLPNNGKGQHFLAVLDRIGVCDNGDEDCSDTGYQEGPGATQSEVSVAVDVTGNHVVVGFNDFRGFNLNPVSLSGYAYSDDGGSTFNDGHQLPAATAGHVSTTNYPEVFGDPSVIYIPGGSGCQFVYASIGVVGLGAAPNYTGTAQTMVVHRSTDCGHNWVGPFEIPAATNPHGGLTSGSANDSADKEYIDVDPDTGRVAISWTNFTSTSFVRGGAEIRLSYSDNIMAGAPPTWSSGTIVNTVTGSGYFDTGSVPRFAGNGSNDVYVAWGMSSLTLGTSYGGWPAINVGFAKSSDNGATFAPAIKLFGADAYPMDQVVGNDRIHSFPIMAVDNSGGSHAGNIYVVVAFNSNGDGSDIAFFKSTDHGATFAPTDVSARPGSDRAQWFPVVVVDNTVAGSGRVHIMFDDQGTTGLGDLMQMSWTYSDDGGTTWSRPTALTRPFHGGYGNDTSQPNLGDYNGLAAQNGNLYAAYTMTPPVALFPDGEPSSTSYPYPSFFISGSGAEAVSGFTKIATAKPSLDLGTITFTDSGGNGLIDAGDQVQLTIPLRNFVTNSIESPLTYSSVTATLSTTTSGVSIQRSTSGYANIASGATASNGQTFVMTLAPNFVPGTKLDMALLVTTQAGAVSLPFILNTGTPVPTAVFSENFNGIAAGTIPAGWTLSHGGGANTVNWTTNSTFCGTPSNGLYHVNANDGPGGTGNPTRFERAFSPVFAVPAAAQYVTVDFDTCYATEDDPGFQVMAYDGYTVRITDSTAGRTLRSVFPEAVAENFFTGSAPNFPKHNPRNSSTAYFQDISMWGGLSGGFKHVTMRLNGTGGSSLQLRFEFTQDSGGTCTDAHPGTTACGVIVDNIVVNSIVTKSDELSRITLRPVPGVAGQWTGTVTSQAFAPSAGITVNLTSSQPTLTTFSTTTLTIPSGSQTSPTFTVTLDPSLAGQIVTITATGPSNVRTAGIQR